MNPDLNALLADLRTLTEIESPSSDPAAVSRVMDVIEGWARDLGAQSCRALPGGTRQFRFGEAQTEEEKGVLVLTHADTVWPVGTLEQMPWRQEDTRLYGPGTYDMKAGIVGLFHVLRAMKDSGTWPRGGVTVLLSPDEEIGSPSSRAHIEAAARGARVVLVVEPPVADTHALKVGRKGTGAFTLKFTGVSSHAGNRPELGASAITAAAEAIVAAQALADHARGTTVSVGLMQGGTAVNVIPGSAELHIDLRVSTLAEAERVTAGIQAIRPSDPRVQLEVLGGVNRPPFEQTPEAARLFEQARGIARDLGFAVGGEVVGGGSDGNFTALIAPTLDGLGAPGDGAHATHEHVRLDRWLDHIRLLHRLMLDA